MASLRNKLIRLAHENPELREHILPLIKTETGTDPRKKTGYGQLPELRSTIVKQITTAIFGPDDEFLSNNFDFGAKIMLKTNVAFRNDDAYYQPESQGDSDLVVEKDQRKAMKQIVDHVLAKIQVLKVRNEQCKILDIDWEELEEFGDATASVEVTFTL